MQKMQSRFSGTPACRRPSVLASFRIFAVAMALAFGADANAQLVGPPTDPLSPPVPASSGIEVLATTYLWFPWTSVEARPSDRRFASRSTMINPGNLYGHLTWVPFMGKAEFRSGPYGLILDYIHAPLKAGVSTRNVLFGGGSAGLTLDTGTAMLLYRPVVQPDQYLDIGIGVRAWGLDGSITLNENLLPSLTVANGLSWADPLLAVRFHRELGNGFGVTGYGDFGGFGVGAHFDWQLVGTIDYAINPRIDAHLGFRSLNFSYGAPRANLTFNMNGPVIAATIRF